MFNVVVMTNAPVLRWNSSVDSGGTFAYQVDIARVTSDGITHTTTPLWSSGQVWLGNWPASSPAFPGLCVYDGEALAPSTTYSFTVQEWQAADHPKDAACRVLLLPEDAARDAPRQKGGVARWATACVD